MLHLLTDEYKKKVEREYRYRVLTVVSLIIIVLCVFGLILITPSYLKIHSTHSKLTAERDSYTEKIKSRQDDNSIDGIKSVQNAITILKSYSQQYSVRDTVLNLASKKQKGISISRFAYSKTKDVPTVDISGKADSRASLMSFSDQLKKDTSFSGVTIPLSSFAREKDIDFSLKLSVISSPTKNEK
jgi:hypothetical protein